MSNEDMWGFKDSKDLKRNMEDTPERILKKQVEKLQNKTDYMLYGKLLYIKINNKDVPYRTATIFEIIVPLLDSYAKTILTMYSNPETDYPVAITEERMWQENDELFVPDYTCNNSYEFRRDLRNIISSEKVTNIVSTLYSKAMIYENEY